MMMMSSMGPMGIAIGVAIDEGIGKDIGKTATAAGFDLSSLLVEGLNRSHVKIDSVRVKRYGFITQRGENDPVAPQLHLDIRIAEKTINIQYPETFPPEDIATWPLDQVKKNGELSREAFTNAIQAIRSSIPNAQ